MSDQRVTRKIVNWDILHGYRDSVWMILYSLSRTGYFVIFMRLGAKCFSRIKKNGLLKYAISRNYGWILLSHKEKRQYRAFCWLQCKQKTKILIVCAQLLRRALPSALESSRFNAAPAEDRLFVEVHYASGRKLFCNKLVANLWEGGRIHFFNLKSCNKKKYNETIDHYNCTFGVS